MINMKELLAKKYAKQVVVTVILLAFMLLSCTVFTAVASNPAQHKKTIQSLDEKKITVMRLTATPRCQSRMKSPI